MTIPLPFTASIFEFSPPLADWPVGLQVAVALLAIALGFAVLIALYRFEMRRIARPFAYALFALRALLVFTVLFAVLFDPQIVKLRKENVPGRVLLAVDTSESMGMIDIERGETLPRIEIANRIVQSLNAELRKKHIVEIVGFDQTLEANHTTAANGQASDFKLPLMRAGDIASDSTSRLVGVVLLSDGRHNWGSPPNAKAHELSARGVPIFPVVMAPDDPPSDVAITEAIAQASTVFQGTTVPIEVAVRATRWPKGTIRVSLELPPNEKGERPAPMIEMIQHPGDDATYRVQLRAKLDRPGPQSLTVKAESQSAPDRFPSNNKRTLRVNAVKERARILLIDGEARWEFHYLHTALGRDPNMEVRSVVFRQPRVTNASDDDVRKFGIPSQRMPTDAEALSAYDCIILGDVEPEQFGLNERERLEKYVAESGGTLVFVAGKRAMPLAFGAENDPIRRLLPIRNPTVWSEKLGFRLTPTPEGSKSWFLQIASTRGESQSLWEQFPPHYWAVTGEPKAGAEVLASADSKPILVRQSFGFGRVLYLGIDSTWRWRYKVGDRYHHRFWGQVAQWAASDRLLPTSNPAGTIRFGTREPTFKPGQPVEIVVRSSEAIPPLPVAALKGARIIQRAEKPGEAEKVVSILPLVAPEGRPHELAGTANDLAPGRYRIELEIPEWAEQLLDHSGKRLSSDFEVLPLEGEEMLELSANRALLNELAKITDGRVYEPSQIKELTELLLSQSAVVEHRTVQPLRSSWWAFTAILLLLCCEWGVRKWAGLP